jgi:hypothetical protein
VPIVAGLARAEQAGVAFPLLEEVVMSRPVPAGYSLTQIMLHWAIALLVTIQIVAHDGIEESFDAFVEGAVPGAGDLRLAICTSSAACSSPC